MLLILREKTSETRRTTLEARKWATGEWEATECIFNCSLSSSYTARCRCFVADFSLFRLLCNHSSNDRRWLIGTRTGDITLHDETAWSIRRPVSFRNVFSGCSNLRVKYNSKQDVRVLISEPSDLDNQDSRILHDRARRTISDRSHIVPFTSVIVELYR